MSPCISELISTAKLETCCFARYKICRKPALHRPSDLLATDFGPWPGVVKAKCKDPREQWRAGLIIEHGPCERKLDSIEDRLRLIEIGMIQAEHIKAPRMRRQARAHIYELDVKRVRPLENFRIKLRPSRIAPALLRLQAWLSRPSSPWNHTGDRRKRGGRCRPLHRNPR